MRDSHDILVTGFDLFKTHFRRIGDPDHTFINSLGGPQREGGGNRKECGA